MKKSSVINFALIFCSFLFLVTCAVGPDYERPDTPAQNLEHYIEAAADAPAGEPDLQKWWLRMDDPQMDALVEKLLAGNLDLRQAAARIKQAWKIKDIQYAGLYPSLSASLSQNRNFRPAESFANIFGQTGSVGSGSSTVRIYDTNIEASLTTNWQLDLFGKIRRAGRAATTRALTAEADHLALVHSLIAELARTRVAIATLQEQLALAEEIVENRAQTLKITESRYERGAENISANDVYLARENLSAAQADIPDIKKNLQEQIYELDVLLGYSPGTTEIADFLMPLAVPLRKTPASVPAALLDQRPDIAGAELRLIAATHDIGVAVADLYPDLTLTGNIGFEDEDYNTLFQSERMIGSLTGEIMESLFEGGRLRAQIDLEKARTEELIAAYTETVLQALQEVEVALSNEKNLVRQIKILEENSKAAQQAAKSASRRYRQGLIPLFQVLESERQDYKARQSLLLARQALWNARVNLYLALGGDWLAEEPLDSIGIKEAES